MNGILLQVSSLAGAAACLFAYFKGPKWKDYRWWNLWGSAILLTAAIVQFNVGFIAMNATWLAITLWRRPQ